MKKTFLAIAGLLMSTVSAFSQQAANTFVVGTEVSAYPKVQWVKGAPVSQFEKDKIYVVECWATWCGPCVANIPHLNDLAQKFDGKIIVIGQGVWEEEKDVVEKFVKEKGNEMSYRVAFSGGDDSDFANEWLKPAGVRGIPHAFVIQNNKVVWMTHPANFSEEAFQMLVDHNFSIAAAMKESPIKKIGIIDSLVKAEKYSEAAPLLEKFIKSNPKTDMGFRSKIAMLEKQGKTAEALAYAKDLSIKDPKMGKPLYYASLAKAKDYKTLLAATDADLKSKPDDINTIFTRYKVFVEQNDYKSAAAMITKATAASQDAGALSTMASLSKYVPAAKKGTEADAAMLKAGQKSLQLSPANMSLALSVAGMMWDKDKNGAKAYVTKAADAMKNDPKQAKYAMVADNVKASVAKDEIPDEKQMREWYQAAAKK